MLMGTGRIGRLHYLGVNIAIGLAVFLTLVASFEADPVTGEAQVGPLVIIVGIAATFLSFTNAIRRLHDCGHSGWLVLLALVPIISMGLTLYLLFSSGDPGRNRYGVPPGLEELPLSADAQRTRMAQIQAAAAEAYTDSRN